MGDRAQPNRRHADDQGRPRVRAAEGEGRRELIVDGAVQSVGVEGAEAVGGYWAAMLPDEKPHSALLLGLGGGTIAHLLVRRFGALPMVGVDDDRAVLDLAREGFGLGQLPELRVVIADAYSFAITCSEHFDYVAVDLFREGEIPRGVTATAFLRQIKRLLTPSGRAVFNLARDRRAASRIHRLSRVFAVEKRILVGLNLVAHCR